MYGIVNIMYWYFFYFSWKYYLLRNRFYYICNCMHHRDCKFRTIAILFMTIVKDSSENVCKQNKCSLTIL